MQSSKVLGFGAVFAFLGVAAGAFGAHALRDHLSAESMAIYQTGVQYQLVHALALVALGCQDRIRVSTIAWFFGIGIVVFTGSLFALAISGQTWWGAVTPIGGLSFLAGWATLAATAFKKPVA